MYLNTMHINQKAPPGVFGGAMCKCQVCQKKYWNNPPPTNDAIEAWQEGLAEAIEKGIIPLDTGKIGA